MQSNDTNVRVRAICELKYEIGNDLVVDYVIRFLVISGVLTDREKNLILSSGQCIGSADDLRVRSDVLRAQSDHLVDLLVKKMEVNHKAYNHFLYILYHEGNYPWIGQKIEELVKHLKDNSNRNTRTDLTGDQLQSVTIDSCSALTPI